MRKEKDCKVLSYFFFFFQPSNKLFKNRKNSFMIFAFFPCTERIFFYASTRYIENLFLFFRWFCEWRMKAYHFFFIRQTTVALLIFIKKKYIYLECFALDGTQWCLIIYTNLLTARLWEKSIWDSNPIKTSFTEISFFILLASLCFHNSQKLLLIFLQCKYNLFSSLIKFTCSPNTQ